jgi:hypothetical protein
MNYKKLNIILGWIVFAIATAVYFLTAESSASFWDCGEYIATAYKLQVGHPPGAPFFQLLGRFFSLFAGGNEANVALMINYMSALSSSFTILFLFWIITYLAKKLALRNNAELTDTKIIAILGSGLVGALAFTFSDSFWFSAVEGEVYAMSSFFSAIVFWAMLKWDAVADQKNSYRWLIFIGFLMGLSIGVHLLNLLAIPAITFIYYFKKYKASWKGILVTGIISILILALVMYGIIPIIVQLAGLFERIFVNSFGAAFNVGTIIYFLLLFGAIIFGIRWTHKKNKVVLNTIILAFTAILIGYSSFLVLVIRSNANTPIDENNPENAISLLAYLNREQYGDWPIFSGHYYNAPVVDYADGNPVYTKMFVVYDGDNDIEKFLEEDSALAYAKKRGGDLEVKGRYVITDDKKGSEPVYDDRFKAIFPRMWSQQRSIHKRAYKQWAHKQKGKAVTVPKPDGTTSRAYIPSAGENFKFFFKYQLGHMYFRYFMWNFAGRQNDIQGHGSPLKGNWISGINFIDKALVGPQDKLPDHLANNAGRNKFFMLPFILGIIGFVFQISEKWKDNIVVLLLFIMTGIAIVIYLNQYPYQPRERDYSYAGSFLAFSIWIGLGVMGIVSWIDKALKNKTLAIGITAACLLLVPGIMAKDGWDDHDRRGKRLALEVAKNYLESCKKNGVIFSNGDNDTFPLWYAQEVEGIRTDLKVVNLSLLNTDWYVDQMARPAYEADGVPFSMKKEQYIQGTRDILYLMDDQNPEMRNVLILYFLDDIVTLEKENYQAEIENIRKQFKNILDGTSIQSRFADNYKKYINPDKPFSKLYLDILELSSEKAEDARGKIGLSEEIMKELRRATEKIINRAIHSPIDLRILMDWVKSDAPESQLTPRPGVVLDFIPTKKIKLKVNKENAVKSGIIAAGDTNVLESVEWLLDERYIQKNHIMVLDFLQNNDWERPVHFAITTGPDSYLNLMEYFRHDGLAYTLIPKKVDARSNPMVVRFLYGSVDTDSLYNLVMNKFDYGTLMKDGIYYDETSRRPLASYRGNFARLAVHLASEGKTEKAIEVLDRSLELLDKDLMPDDTYLIAIAEGFMAAGDTVRGNELADLIVNRKEKELNYYSSFSFKRRETVQNDIGTSIQQLRLLKDAAQRYQYTAVLKRTSAILQIYGQ